MNTPFSTRLRLTWLWYRHMWPTLWAHKPLCDRLRRDVIRLGPVRLCRSCFCVYAGLFLTGAMLLASREAAAVMVPGPLLLTLLVVVPVSIPPVYRRVPRLGRDAVRLALGALVATSVFALATESWMVGAGALLLLLAAWRVLLRWRAASRSDVCAGCPELGAPGVCPGYAPQSERFRAYEREASALIEASGFVPAMRRTRG